MDKYEARRLALKALTQSFGHGGIAHVASKISKEPNYVSRMLYEPGKKGAKRIGEESVEALNREFPGWLPALDQDPIISELAAVVSRLTSSGRMKEEELQNMLAMLKAREDSNTP